MKIKNLTKEEIEAMPFDDLAYEILKENDKKMKINQIFKTICDELELGDKAYEEQIGDFFALLATEKRFIQLEKGYWDLRENHTSEIDINDIEEDEEELVEENVNNEENEDDYYDSLDETDDDEADDDLKDLVIVDENYDEESDL